MIFNDKEIALKNSENDRLSSIEFKRVLNILHSCKHEGQVKIAYNYYKLFEQKWSELINQRTLNYTREIFFTEIDSLPFTKDKLNII